MIQYTKNSISLSTCQYFDCIHHLTIYLVEVLSTVQYLKQMLTSVITEHSILGSCADFSHTCLDVYCVKNGYNDIIQLTMFCIDINGLCFNGSWDELVYSVILHTV